MNVVWIVADTFRRDIHQMLVSFMKTSNLNDELINPRLELRL